MCLGSIQHLVPRKKVRRKSPWSHIGLIERGTKIKVLCYRVETQWAQDWETKFGQTSVQCNVWFMGKSYQNCCTQWNENAYHFCQEQHCAVAVLALSSSFVNKETWGKVFTEAWRESHIVVSETPHKPGKYLRASSQFIRKYKRKSSRSSRTQCPSYWY